MAERWTNNSMYHIQSRPNLSKIAPYSSYPAHGPGPCRPWRHRAASSHSRYVEVPLRVRRDYQQSVTNEGFMWGLQLITSRAQNVFWMSDKRPQLFGNKYWDSLPIRARMGFEVSHAISRATPENSTQTCQVAIGVAPPSLSTMKPFFSWASIPRFLSSSYSVTEPLTQALPAGDKIIYNVVFIGAGISCLHIQESSKHWAPHLSALHRNIYLRQ